MGAFLVFGSVQLYTLRLRRQKQILEGVVAKRTEELSHSLLATQEAWQVAETAKRKAEKASAFKSVFIANTSHELRTPLNAILGFMRLLSTAKVRDEERRRYQDIVLNSGESLLQIVNDLLDLSKIEAGKLDVESKPFDLREVVENVLSILGNRANEKQLPLVAFVDIAIPEILQGDGHRVQQMMINLLGNALKFTHRGHIALRVTGEVQGDDAWLIRAVVEDTGPGVPADVLPRLFTAFSQADSDAKRLGTGLGLSITRQLAELMGGRTGAESTVGEGSRFWFSFCAPALASVPAAQSLCLVGRRFRLDIELPILREQVEHILLGYGATLSPDGEWITDDPELKRNGKGLLLMDHPGDPALSWLQRPFGELALLRVLGALTEGFDRQRALTPQHYTGKILVADDNPANRLLMQALFGQYGLTPVMAEDGLEAVEHVEREAFDLIILDGRMPKLDGPAALSRIRELPHGHHAPVLLFTASLTMQGVEAAMQAGFDDVLQKPIEQPDFQAVVLSRLRPLDAPAMSTPVRGDSVLAPETDTAPENGVELDTVRLNGMLGALGGKDGLLDFAEAVFQDLPRRMDKLKIALDAEDRETLSREAHDLKSNAASMGLMAPARLAERMEHEAESADLETLAACYVGLVEILPSALAELKAWMKKQI